MVYAVSDLHGYKFEKFMTLLEKADFSQDDTLYVIGDVIDRGTDGIKILKWIMKQPNVKFILGNHEDFMLGCKEIFLQELKNYYDITEMANVSYEALDTFFVWEYNGCENTVFSLLDMKKEERKVIFEFLENSPLYEEITVNGRDFILTHAGLGNFDENKKLSEYTKDELLWNRPTVRQGKTNEIYFQDKTVVFGHTPTVNYGKQYIGKAFVTDTWINIDGGAGWGYFPILLRLDDLKEFI